jgi:uncharacterized protein
MLLHVKIKPNQRFDRVERIENQWQLRLKAPAVDGKANEYLISYLSDILGIPKSSIILQKGQNARFKTLEINSPEIQVLEKLESAAAKG